jgi:hypothetical protein
VARIVEFILRAVDDASGVVEGFGDAADNAAGSSEGLDGAVGGLGEGLDGLGESAAGAAEKASGLAGQAAALGPVLAEMGLVVTALGAAMFETADAMSQLVDGVVNAARAVGATTDTITAFGAALQATTGDASRADAVLLALAGRINDAQQGSERAERAFADLGVALDDGTGNARSFDAILVDVLDNLGNMTDEADRSSARIEIFGRRNAAAVAALGEGTEALRTWGEAAAEAGAQLDQGAIRASQAMDETMTRLRLATDGLTLALGEAFTPAVTDTVEALAGLVRLGTTVAEPIQELGDAIRNVMPLLVAFDVATEFFGGLEGRAQKAADAAEQVRRAMAGLGSEAEEQREPFADLTGGVSDLDRVLLDVDGSTGSAARAMADLGPIIDTLAGEVFALADAFAAGKASEEELEFAALELSMALEEGTISLEEYRDAISSLTEAAMGAARELPELREKLPKLTDDDIRTMLEQGEAAGAAFGEGLQQQVSMAFAGLTDPTALAGAAGPIGAAIAAGVQGLAGLGATGAEGVASELRSLTDDVTAGLAELGPLLGETIPNALNQAIPAFFDAFVANADEIFLGLLKGTAVIAKELALDLPIQILKSVGEALSTWWNDAWSNIKAFFKDLFTFGLAGDRDRSALQISTDIARALAAIGTFGTSELAIQGGQAIAGAVQRRRSPASSAMRSREARRRAAGLPPDGVLGGQGVTIVNQGVFATDAIAALDRRLVQFRGPESSFGRQV